MKEHEVRERAFAMPLTSPAYPVGPYRFYHREFFIITYRTDPRKLREVARRLRVGQQGDAGACHQPSILANRPLGRSDVFGMISQIASL